jgi:hypothetical protein
MGRVFFGTRLTRRQSEIFSVIDRFGKAGGAATVPYLAELFYPDKPAAVADQTVRVIVSQINDRLAGTDYRITSSRLAGYRIQQEGPRAVHHVHSESRHRWHPKIPPQ